LTESTETILIGIVIIGIVILLIGILSIKAPFRHTARFAATANLSRRYFWRF